MKPNRKPIRELLDHAQKTFVRSRPGSVLILVIALLVLMALIGTAFMSMAQNDRTTSVQHANNTEIDMLMDGLASILKGTITTELWNQGFYRPSTSYNAITAPPTPPSFQNYTGLGHDALTVAGTTINAGSPFLAARVPELQNEVGTNDGGYGPANQVTWSFITAPLIGGQFSSPLPPHGTAPFLVGQTATSLNTYTQRANFRATGRYMVPGVYAPGSTIPAWVDPANPNANSIAAADADGDGIADSGFIKLPIGSINGVTYYVAYRIVDASSAINVNTAWQHNPQFAVAQTISGPAANVGSMPGDFFPSSIDLSELATGADQGINAVIQRHFNASPTPTQAWAAFDDNGNPRGDLTIDSFGTALEASWMQMGRRLSNPGYSTNNTTRFQTYSRTDLAGLVHSFVVRDPSLAASTLESDLPNSLYNTVANSRFDASFAPQWYVANFAFLATEYATTGTPNPLPLRSLLTTENAVSNYAPNTFRDRKAFTPRPDFAFGDSVVGPDGRRYVCVDPVQASTPAPANVQPGPYTPAPIPLPKAPPANVAQSLSSYYDNDTWVQMPWVDAPTKISVNTGTFGQLWLAYWSVMGDHTFNTGTKNIDITAPFPNALGGPLNPRMFRSPLRIAPPIATPATPSVPLFRLMPSQVMQLRAAIAAVNTIDMRDNDDDVTSRKIDLVATEGAAPFPRVLATVYGQEPQPYITEVYATNAQVTPAVGYVAIKLFNPYNVPLDLSNYRLGSIVRSSTTPAGLADFDRTIVEIPPDAATFWNPGTAPVIPPNGFIIIASQAGPYGTVAMPASLTPILTAANLPVAPGQFAQYIMSQLPTALDREIVLLRPRRGNNAVYGAAGGYTAATGSTTHSPVGDFTEVISGVAHLADMVPVDSYDLSGLIPLIAPDVAVEWHYLRPSDGESTALDSPTSWHWVYPGHYRFSNVTTPNPYPNEDVGAALSFPPRLVDGTHRGLFPGMSFNPNAGVTQVLTVPTGLVTAGPLELWTLGQYFSPTAYTNNNNVYRDIPLRLNSPDMGGPNNTLHQSRITGSPGRQNNAFPYGGFARNGDILNVPFIGAYKLQLPGQDTNTFMELNPATMDSVMALSAAQMNWNETGADAETTTGNCDPLVRLPVPLGQGVTAYENVGRFSPIPLLVNEASILTNSARAIDDLGNSPRQWRYHFATRLLDFLTVQSPQQDYMVDVDPAPVDALAAGSQNPTLPYKYPLTSSTLVPLPVANTTPGTLNAEESNTADPTEQIAGVHGLVNINTAPWRVLAAVPWLPPQIVPSSTNSQHQLNATIAMSIVYYRDINDGTGVPHGPFKNLFELANVPMTAAAGSLAGSIAPITLFKNILRDTAPFNTYSDLQRGNLQANVATATLTNADLTQGDYINQNMMMTRASNLVTTRSDQFVAYILLQGWTNAETTNAQMVVQRRAAYLIDRTNVTGTNGQPSMTYIPNN